MSIETLLERIAVALETRASAPLTVASSPTTKATPAPAAAKPTATAGKPAATQAAKPAATKPATTKPAATAPAPKLGKYDLAQVRDAVQKVTRHEALGKDEAFSILEEEAGVRNVSQIKPADYDKVYEACMNALNGAGGTTQVAEEAIDEFDPTA